MLCLDIKSAVEKLKFISVQFHQRNTVDGKLVFPSRCAIVEQSQGPRYPFSISPMAIIISFWLNKNAYDEFSGKNTNQHLSTQVPALAA